MLAGLVHKLGFIMGTRKSILVAWHGTPAIVMNKRIQFGEREPNAWGFYDMHGNVAEWCYDWAGDYPIGEAEDWEGPDQGVVRTYPTQELQEHRGNW